MQSAVPADLPAFPCWPSLLQRIEISCGRTFQQPKEEPLGPDWGQAEMRRLVTAREDTAAAIRKAQSNADPFAAGLRQDLAQVQRRILSLPEGEERAQLRQAVSELRSKAEQAAVQAKLPLTKARAGKVARRQQGRQDNQAQVTALHPSRKRSGVPLVQQQGAAFETGDDFQPKAKKGRKAGLKVRAGVAAPLRPPRSMHLHALCRRPASPAHPALIVQSMQVRGVTKDIQGTTIRGGGPHVRLSAEKKRRARRTATAVAAGVPPVTAALAALR